MCRASHAALPSRFSAAVSLAAGPRVSAAVPSPPSCGPTSPHQLSPSPPSSRATQDLLSGKQDSEDPRASTQLPGMPRVPAPAQPRSSSTLLPPPLRSSSPPRNSTNSVQDPHRPARPRARTTPHCSCTSRVSRDTPSVQPRHTPAPQLSPPASASTAECRSRPCGPPEPSWSPWSSASRSQARQEGCSCRPSFRQPKRSSPCPSQFSRVGDPRENRPRPVFVERIPPQKPESDRERSVSIHRTHADSESPDS
mmetsp:Transcript_48432/g.114254  ORF Transcript_48432/g.114254 Transcript_48432/m.114254 type:complete len:253 (+) Transcript_48432:777-1535(+)